MVSMPQARLGDLSTVPSDSHGCPACPHPAIGPAVAGSPDVLVNGKAAIRVGDPGIHAACCGPNTWKAAKGSKTVFINDKAAHRVGDEDTHCGGKGVMIQGSPNVYVGGMPSIGVSVTIGPSDGTHLTLSADTDGTLGVTAGTEHVKASAETNVITGSTSASATVTEGEFEGKIAGDKEGGFEAKAGLKVKEGEHTNRLEVGVAKKAGGKDIKLGVTAGSGGKQAEMSAGSHGSLEVKVEAGGVRGEATHDLETGEGSAGLEVKKGAFAGSVKADSKGAFHAEVGLSNAGEGGDGRGKAGGGKAGGGEDGGGEDGAKKPDDSNFLRAQIDKKAGSDAVEIGVAARSAGQRADLRADTSGKVQLDGQLDSMAVEAKADAATGKMSGSVGRADKDQEPVAD